MTQQVSADLPDIRQICCLCDREFIDWERACLDFCPDCSEDDQIDPSPDDPDANEIERLKAEIRASKPQERIVDGREDELEHRRALRRMRALPRHVEDSEGALPSKIHKPLRGRKTKDTTVQREMF